MNFQDALKSLEEVKFSGDNQYIGELEQVLSQKDSKEKVATIKQAARYIVNPDISRPLPSGIKELDDYLASFVELAERYEKEERRKPQLSPEEFMAVTSMALTMQSGTFNPSDLSEKERQEMDRTWEKWIVGQSNPLTMQYRSEQARFAQFLKYLLQDAQKEGTLHDGDYDDLVERIQRESLSLATPDLTIPESAHNNPLIAVYKREKPNDNKERKIFCERVVKATLDYGIEHLFGEAPCPVDSFRNLTIEETGLVPTDFHATEFAYFIIRSLIKAGDRDLARKVYEAYETELSILPSGKQGFDTYEEFTDGNCAGCLFGPSDCKFMTKNRTAVAKGQFYRMKCIERYNGTMISEPGEKPRALNLADGKRDGVN